MRSAGLRFELPAATTYPGVGYLTNGGPQLVLDHPAVPVAVSRVDSITGKSFGITPHVQLLCPLAQFSITHRSGEPVELSSMRFSCSIPSIRRMNCSMLISPSSGCRR